MAFHSTEFYRLDPLTGCNNFLSFVETLNQMASSEEKHPFSILYTGLNYMGMLNKTRGRAYGDSALRWLEIVLREETNTLPYRVDGDEFVVILTSETRASYEELLSRLFKRLNREGEQLGIPIPAARISLIHYDNDANISLNDVIFQLGEATLDTKTRRDRTINVLLAKDLIRSKANPDDNEDATSRTLRGIANIGIWRVLNLSRMLDEAQKTSYLDSISGLPNMRAAFLQVDKVLNDALASNQSFSVLLIDGDNLRLFNDISYAMGDDMIKNLSAVLSDNLRPGDFVARWRTGDEFIVILPNTTSEGAKIVGERFCSAVRETSHKWIFPTSISIGISTYPQHGDNLNALVDVAERAMKHAKDEGKDRIVMAGL